MSLSTPVTANGNPTNCPCGSGASYRDCCRPYHRGEAIAPTPEALMRSRYSAFALGGQGEYLLATWAVERRDPALTATTLDARDTDWCELEILATRTAGNHGEVEFKAHSRAADGSRQTLHERSYFERRQKRWYYVNGDVNGDIESNTSDGSPSIRHGAVPRRPAVGRNQPCPCGSGKKAKRCCHAT